METQYIILTITGFILATTIYLSVRGIKHDLKDPMHNILNELTQYKQRIEALETTFTQFVSTQEQKQKIGFNRNSPLTLTEWGRSILYKSGGKNWIDKHIDELIPEFEMLNKEYEIEDKAMELMVKKRNDIDRSVREFVYNENIEYDYFLKIMAVELIDRVVNKKGMSITRQQQESIQVKDE